MVQCDLCLNWFHFVCEQVTNKDAKKEQWFCSACRVALAETERTYASHPSEGAENMGFIHKSLNILNNFFDYLMEETGPIKEKNLRIKLMVCKLKIEKILNMYDGRPVFIVFVELI